MGVSGGVQLRRAVLGDQSSGIGLPTAGRLPAGRRGRGCGRLTCEFSRCGPGAQGEMEWDPWAVDTPVSLLPLCPRDNGASCLLPHLSPGSQVQQSPRKGAAEAGGGGPLLTRQQ